MRKVSAIFSTILLFSCASEANQSPINATSAAQDDRAPVDTFMGVCMGSLGDSARARDMAIARGFVASTADQAKKLIRNGAKGEAFSKGQIAIVLESGGLCTVFAHAGSQEAVHAQLKKELPPPTTPFKVTEEVLSPSSNNTSSTAYHLVLPTRPFADWVFSTYQQPGEYNVAISMVLRGTN